METKNYVYEGLSKYSTDANQIGTVLLELDLDPHAEEFPDGTLKEATGIYEALGVAKTKAIASAPNTEDISYIVHQIAQECTQLLQQQGVRGFAVDTLLYLAEAVLEEGVQIGDYLVDLRKRAIASRLNAGDDETAQELLDAFRRGTERIKQVFAPENQQALIDAEVTHKPVDTATFITHMDKVRSERLQRRDAGQKAVAATHQEVKVDVAEFLRMRGR